MYGLQSNEIDAINNVFAKYIKVEKVLLFGSRAKGTQNPVSDIDITIIGKNITHKDLSEITSDLNDLLLPYEIDISIFDEIDNIALKERILQSDVVFYEKRL
ncbi:MAG: nucleotidyltransferase domain-containing protein [Bacteroidales bacterium]